MKFLFIILYDLLFVKKYIRESTYKANNKDLQKANYGKS